MDVKIDCLCPPNARGETRHPDGDTVTLRERLDFRAALTARNTMALLKNEDPDASVADILAALTETYLLVGVTGWTLVDAKNKPVDVSRAAIRELLLSNPDVAMLVGDAADEHYSEAVILPLLARARNSSPPTPIAGSTSATKRSTPKSRKPSSPSSITTIPTDATATTSSSPVGDSSSSPSLRSAG
jgi:hypothetical protein